MGAQAVLNAMKVHRGNPDVILTASHAINNIALQDQNRTFLASLGIVPILIDLMNAYSQNPKILAAVAGAVWEIAVPDQNQVLLLQHGATALCCAMLRTHTTDAAVQSKCIGILWNITVSSTTWKFSAFSWGNDKVVSSRKCTEFSSRYLFSEAGEQEVKRNGGLQLMISAMERFPDVVNIHEPALGAFWNMIVHDSMQLCFCFWCDLASAPGAIRKYKRLIQQSQAKFPQSTRVQEKAGKILPRL